MGVGKGRVGSGRVVYEMGTIVMTDLFTKWVMSFFLCKKYMDWVGSINVNKKYRIVKRVVKRSTLPNLLTYFNVPTYYWPGLLLIYPDFILNQLTILSNAEGGTSSRPKGAWPPFKFLPQLVEFLVCLAIVLTYIIRSYFALYKARIIWLIITFTGHATDAVQIYYNERIIFAPEILFIRTCEAMLRQRVQCVASCKVC